MSLSLSLGLTLSGSRTAAASAPLQYVPDVASGTLVLAAGLKIMRPTAGPNAALIVKPSDQSTGTNIGWSGQNIDRAAAATYQGADASVYCKTLYDQSGNGNHLTQATYANMLQLYLGTADKHVCFNNGRRTGVNINSNGAPRRLTIPPLLGTDRNSCTILVVMRMTAARRNTTSLEMGNVAASPDVETRAYDTYFQLTPRWDDAGTAKSPGFGDSFGGSCPSASLCVSAFRSTGSAVKVWRDAYSISPSTNNAITSREFDDGGQLGTSHNFAGNNNNEVLGVLVYRGALNDADMATVIASLRTIYTGAAPTQTHHLFLMSDSLGEGIMAYDQRNLVRQLEDNLSGANIMCNWGLSGVTASTLAGYHTGGFYRWIMSGLTNVIIYWAGTNDIEGGATAATTWASACTAIDNYRARCSERSVTSKVVMATCIRRTSFESNPTKETARVDYNNLIRANAHASTGLLVWDALVDIDTIPAFAAVGAPSNTALYASDAIHLIENGYTTVEPLFRAALNSVGVS